MPDFDTAKTEFDKIFDFIFSSEITSMLLILVFFISVDIEFLLSSV